MSETSVLIKVGFQGAAALAGLGSVSSGITKVGGHIDALKVKQKALGESIQKYMGTLAPASLRALNDEYEALGKSIERAGKLQASLVAGKHRAATLRSERQELRSDALDAVGIGAMALVPVKLAIDFESAMSDVKKVVDFDTPDGFQKLSDEILKMSRHLPMSVEQLAQIAASGGQLGVAAKDIPAFVEQIAKMATAFDMSAESAGDSMAKLANVYNIPITKISKLGDAINQLSNESPAKASDIVTTLGRIGGVAKQFGLTEIQAASLSNAFISLGKAPEVAGTSINALLLKLQTADKQGAKFQSALSQMGMSATGLKHAIKNDAEGALLGFLQAMGNVSSDKQLGLLVDLFGLEYADDIAVLAGSIKSYKDSISTVKGPNVDGSMDREFQERAKTTAANLQRLKNSFNELGTNIGSAVLPALNDLVDVMRPVVGAIATWAKENPGLAGGVVKLVVVFAGLKLGLIGLRYGFNLVSAAANGLRMGWNLLQAAGLMNPALWVRLAGGARLVGTAIMWVGRALLMNPIGLLVTGIAVAGYLIYKHWSTISKFFTDLAGKFRAWGSAMIDGLVGGIQARFQAAKAAVVGMATNIKGWFTDVLGIRSPSRVFMGFGANIGEGAQIGISRSIGKVAQASGRLAQAARGAIAGAAMAGAAGAGAAGMAGMTIHYSPNITVQGGAAGDVVPAMQQALKISEREFEQMLNRTLAQRQRRNF